MTGDADNGPAGAGPTDLVIDEAAEVTDDLVEAFVRLIPQLSRSSAPTTRDELEAIVASDASILLMARHRGGRILGSLTLGVFRIPTGVRAWIEDVVVDGDARGAGVGEALVTAAVERARAEGAKTVDLTSRPDRESANRLYVRAGFALRTTNVYRFSLEA